MRLIRLVIMRADSVVRSIEFKQGLNLILDKPTQESIQSGNNVGKTTVLRLIDFCLGSDGDDIWQDSEFKSVNQDVYDYLHGSVPVSIAMTVENIIRETQYCLKRSFGVKKISGAAFFIDEITYKNVTDYRVAVKQLLFGSSGAKPTLRQLAPKFVRSSQGLMSKTLKFLGEYTREVDYEA